MSHPSLTELIALVTTPGDDMKIGTTLVSPRERRSSVGAHFDLDYIGIRLKGGLSWTSVAREVGAVAIDYADAFTPDRLHHLYSTALDKGSPFHISVPERAEIERIARVATPNLLQRFIPLITPWKKDNICRLLVPIQEASTSKSMPCQPGDSAMITKDLLQSHCDDASNLINELNLFAYLKAQRRLQHYLSVSSRGVHRPQRLTDERIAKFARGYAEEASERHYSDMPGAELRPLGDITLGVESLYHQSEETNSVLLLVAVAYSDNELGVRGFFDSQLPRISAAVLANIGMSDRRAPKPTVDRGEGIDHGDQENSSTKRAIDEVIAGATNSRSNG